MTQNLKAAARLVASAPRLWAIAELGLAKMGLDERRRAVTEG